MRIQGWIPRVGRSPSPPFLPARAADVADTVELRSEQPTPDLSAALQAYRQSAQRPYYDAEADRQARDAYYRGASNLAGQDLFAPLSRLLRDTHRRELGYDPARYVYPWVDLQPDRQLRSIYSGREIDPEQAIRQELDPVAWSAELLIRPELACARAALQDAEEAFNCEHVVPQSWFERQQPMRGDLHHLFACDPVCNSYRGNLAYYDFPDYGQTDRDGCGHASHETDRFEPESGKGAVARATLYFLLRYPGELSQYRREDIETLLRWHREHPVSLHEQHRNAAIQELQGNRNPLIDFPEWADRIDFARGLAA
ncbi:MAG: endonuclease [Armatimonadetes bacterium]|nr:endonuclease [Armatimonadota bacterium]